MVVAVNGEGREEGSNLSGEGCSSVGLGAMEVAGRCNAVSGARAGRQFWRDRNEQAVQW